MLASAPPTEAGSSRPMLGWSGRVPPDASARAAAPPTSARPKVSARPVASAMQNEPHRASRSDEPPRRALRADRGGAPSPAVPTDISASRTSAAGVVEGSGAPNATVTGYGIRAGHFQKKRPPLKLKMLPQTRSRYTGMIGTSRPFDDLLEAALERQQVAGAADRALGEDADDVTVLELLRARRRSTPAPRARRRPEWRSSCRSSELNAQCS